MHHFIFPSAFTVTVGLKFNIFKLPVDLQRDGFQTGIYSNTVVLQHHSVVMTKADKIYKVKCTYDMSSKNITFGMMPIRDPEMISITSAPEAPPPRIRILDSRSREVETVRIGDKLTFRIEIPEDSKFRFMKILGICSSWLVYYKFLFFSSLWNFRPKLRCNG